MMEDPELRIARPRQIYTGPRDTDYIPMDER
jgi:citrate synthase